MAVLHRVTAFSFLSRGQALGWGGKYQGFSCNRFAVVDETKTCSNRLHGKAQRASSTSLITNPSFFYTSPPRLKHAPCLSLSRPRTVVAVHITPPRRWYKIRGNAPQALAACNQLHLYCMNSISMHLSNQRPATIEPRGTDSISTFCPNIVFLP